MNIEYTVQIWQEGKDYIAHAMPLDVMSAGATPKEAGKALQEAVSLFIETAKETGTLEDVLDEEHEPGEEQLAALIKEAGDEARARKKKVMELHYKKLKAAVAEGVSRRQKHTLP